MGVFYGMYLVLNLQANMVYLEVSDSMKWEGFIMAIATDVIIQKMQEKLHLAKAEQANQNQLAKHIEAVHLLCELILDEESEQRVDHGKDITKQEMKAMIEGNQPKRTVTAKQEAQAPPTVDTGSLFDF